MESSYKIKGKVFTVTLDKLSDSSFEVRLLQVNQQKLYEYSKDDSYQANYDYNAICSTLATVQQALGTEAH